MTSNSDSSRDRVRLLAGPPVVERRVQLAGVSTATPLRVIDDAAHTLHIERPETFVRAMFESIPAQPSSEAESP